MTTASQDIADIIAYQTAKFEANTRVTMTTEEAAEEAVANLVNRSVRGGEWLNKQQFPPLQYAVEPILAEGYGLLVGPPKAGKSWLVASIALAVAEQQGGVALGSINVPFRPVLYFALEDGDRRLQERCRAIAGRDYIPKYFMRVLDVRDLNELILIAEAMQDRYSKHPMLIIVDTLGKIAPSKMGGQTQFDADYKLGSALQRLAKRVPGTTVLAVHHNNKGDHADFIQAASGTQGVTAACDTILVLSRARGSNEAVLDVTGRDIERETSYALVSEGGHWKLKGGDFQSAEDAAGEVRAAQAEAAQTAKYGDRSNAVVEAVTLICSEEGKDFATPKEVAEEAGMSNDDAGKYLRRLEKAGRILRHGRGSYKPLSEVSETSYSQLKAQNNSDTIRTLSETKPLSTSN